MITRNQLKDLKVNSKPLPTSESSDFEKLEYEHAQLYEAYLQRGKEVKALEDLVAKYQTAFGNIDKAIQGVLR